MKFLLIFFFTLFLVVPINATASEKKWTVFVIINGDNFNEMTDEATLESEQMAPKIYSEFKQEALRAPHVRTVIFYDPYDSFELGPFEWRDSSILEIISDGKIQKRVKLDETDLTKPATITGAIREALQGAYTQQNILYFWTHELPPHSRHADRFSDFFDYSHPQSSYGVELFRKSLMDAGFDGVHRKFDAIVMSNCWSSNLHALFSLGDLTNYYLGVASTVLYEGGLSRTFIQDLQNDLPIEKVLEGIYQKTITAFQAPRLDPIACDLGVPKKDPKPAVFQTRLMPALKLEWESLMEIMSGHYGWIFPEILMHSQSGQTSKDWIDIMQFLNSWKIFFDAEARRNKNIFASVGLDHVFRVEKLLEHIQVEPYLPTGSRIILYSPLIDIPYLQR